MKLEALWYRSSVLTTILRPLSWLFRCAVFIRRLFYRLGIKTSAQMPVPVIVVGNLTVGGVGKTPLVAWIANLLHTQGYRPGIMSRGFKGRSTHWPQEVTKDSDPRLVGDEPVLLASRTECPVVVDPNRVLAAQYLIQHYGCDVLISDDGLQHYALSRDIEIAVVDGLRCFGNRLCLPAGPLREPLRRLNNVDFIVCNGADHPDWFTMHLVPGDLYNLADTTQRLSLTASREREWQVLAGIGHPERFFLELKNRGLSFQQHPFPDHHVFSKSEIDFGTHANVLMTEKDAVKCRRFADHRHWCLPVTASLSTAFQSHLIERLKAVSKN